MENETESTNKVVDMETAELENRFTYHPPKEGQADIYTDIRDRAFALVMFINSVCPESREKSLAVTKIEEAVMWANAGIARRGSSKKQTTPTWA